MENKYDVEEYLKIWDETENGLEIIINSHFELKEIGGSFYIIKKKYPKTYIECAKILDCFSASHIDGYKNELLEKFQELLIARDAYWKIAGEQMGLGKPWDLVYNENQYDKPTYFIVNKLGEIYKDNANIIVDNRILAFPTKEMRDVFYNNFKNLIETCKELL